MVTEPIEAPVESFAEMVPVTEIFPGSGDLAGIVNVVTLASDATAIGHDGIANEIVCLMIGIVIVQFAPQSGHEAASGMMPSSCVCVVERGRVSVCVGGGGGKRIHVPTAWQAIERKRVAAATGTRGRARAARTLRSRSNVPPVIGLVNAME